MATPQLIVCGSIAIDRIMSFSGRYNELIHADKLDVLSLSVLVDSLSEINGGIGANIAYNSAQLGERPVLLGSVGPNAKAYIDTLAEAGVDTQFVYTSDLPTACFQALTDSDHNQVSGFYPGAMVDSASLTLDRWIGRDVFVCLSAHDPNAMRQQAETCHREKIRMLYDPGQQVSVLPAEDLRAGLAAAEVVTVNEYEHETLRKKVGLSAEELAASVPILIVTLGKQGSTISGSSLAKPLTIGSGKPAQEVDPTGAGDAYRAGFLYGYLRKWDLQVCGQLGAVIASFILEQHGPQCRVSKQDIMSRYKLTFNEEVAL